MAGWNVKKLLSIYPKYILILSSFDIFKKYHKYVIISIFPLFLGSSAHTLHLAMAADKKIGYYCLIPRIDGIKHSTTVF